MMRVKNTRHRLGENPDLGVLLAVKMREAEKLRACMQPPPPRRTKPFSLSRTTSRLARLFVRQQIFGYQRAPPRVPCVCVPGGARPSSVSSCALACLSRSERESGNSVLSSRHSIH
jgi:hypothetical protein